MSLSLAFLCLPYYIRALNLYEYHFFLSFLYLLCSLFFGSFYEAVVCGCGCQCVKPFDVTLRGLNWRSLIFWWDYGLSNDLQSGMRYSGN